MSKADPTTREEALERRVQHLETQRERALTLLEGVAESFQAEAGNHHTSARKEAYAACAEDLEPILEVLREP